MSGMENENKFLKFAGKGTIAVVATISILLFVWYLMSGISYRNREKTLRANFVGVISSNKADFDAMWKIINQSSQVPEKYSEDFTKAYSTILASGKGTDQNAVKNLFAVATGMKMPQLDPSMYKEVQRVIESGRIRFANDQRMAAAMKAEHDALRTTWPGSMFLGNVKPLDLQLVTSTKTEEAFKTGKDDDTSLYGGKK